MARPRIEDFDKDELIAQILELKKKLEKKSGELIKARAKLSTCKAKVHKMKFTIDYQRSRILQLYRGESLPDSLIK